MGGLMETAKSAPGLVFCRTAAGQNQREDDVAMTAAAKAIAIAPIIMAPT